MKLIRERIYYKETFIRYFYKKIIKKIFLYLDKNNNENKIIETSYIIVYKYNNEYYDIDKTIFKDTISKNLFKIIAPYEENNNKLIYVKNIKDELDTYKIKLNDFKKHFIPINNNVSWFY